MNELEGKKELEHGMQTGGPACGLQFYIEWFRT